MKLSVAPSIEEKLSFLLHNRIVDDEKKASKSVVDINDFDSIDNLDSRFFADLADSSHMSEYLPTSTSRQALNIKREECTETLIKDRLRRKVCRKVYSILKDEYKLPSAEAKNLTLNLEERVNLLYPSYSSAKQYVLTIKSLFNKLKVCSLYQTNRMNLKSLANLSHLNIDAFSKLRSSAKFVEQL